MFHELQTCSLPFLSLVKIRCSNDILISTFELLYNSTKILQQYIPWFYGAKDVD